MEEGDIYIHILYIWMNKFCIYGRERYQHIEYMDETILYKWKCDIYTSFWIYGWDTTSYSNVKTVVHKAVRELVREPVCSACRWIQPCMWIFQVWESECFQVHHPPLKPFSLSTKDPNGSSNQWKWGEISRKRISQESAFPWEFFLNFSFKSRVTSFPPPAPLLFTLQRTRMELKLLSLMWKKVLKNPLMLMRKPVKTWKKVAVMWRIRRMD